VGAPAGGNPGTNSVTVKPAVVTPSSLPSNLTVQLREMQVCVSGVFKTVLGYFSEPY
jgi:hypothetical protein